MTRQANDASHRRNLGGDAHVIGLLTSLRPTLLQGGTVLISPGFDAGATNRRLADPTLGVTHYFCVPQMARMLREHPDFTPARWTSLTAIFTGGAPNPATDIRWWLAQGVRMSIPFFLKKHSWPAAGNTEARQASAVAVVAWRSRNR